MTVNNLLVGLIGIWFLDLLEKPPDAGAQDALHADTQFRETAELLAAEVHADGRELGGKTEPVLGLAVAGEGIPGPETQLGIQAHALPVEPGELHHGHHAEIAHLEFPVGRFRPVAGHIHGGGRRVVDDERASEAQPVIDIADILYAHSPDEIRILEGEMPEGKSRPQHTSRHIRKLRKRELAVRDRKLIPILVVLGKDGEKNCNTKY